MSVASCYIDTSALAKWYLPEAGSEEFERFVRALPDPVSGRLVTVELRCLLARRRREGTLDREREEAAYALFLRDVADGHIRVEPMPDHHYAEAVDLLQRLPAVALRTLDALHLAAALGYGARGLATADRAMATAASALGLEVTFFGVRA
jgi:predicted nucleic acid-binding protein